MEMLLQRGERRGEGLRVSGCVGQTVLAVATRCGPHCVWVWMWAGGSAVCESGVTVFLLYCMYLSVCPE